MGRPKKVVLVDDEMVLEDPVSQTEMDIEDFVESHAPDTAYVEIYTREKEGNLKHQERVGLEILKADMFGYLRENYEQGKFVLRFKNPMGRVIKGMTIDVGPGPKHARPKETVASNGVTNGNSDLSRELLLALIASLRPPDMGAMMSGMAAMIQANKPAPVANNGQSDIAALMGSMVNVWQSLRPKEEDSLSRFKDMVAITRDLMPDNGPKEESLLSVAKDVAGKVVDVLGGKGSPAPTAPARPMLYPIVSQPVQLNPVGAETPAPANDVSQEPMLDDSYWLKNQLDYLKKKAAIGKDPLDWVDYILDNQEEPGCQVVVSALRRGATFEHLLHFDDEIGKSPLYMTWFRTFYNELRTELFSDVDTTRTRGNAPNVGSDAGASAIRQPEASSSGAGEPTTKPDSH